MSLSATPPTTTRATPTPQWVTPVRFAVPVGTDVAHITRFGEVVALCGQALPDAVTVRAGGGYTVRATGTAGPLLCAACHDHVLASLAARGAVR